MNCVRKHLSRIKGGRLAAAAFPARTVSLVISDVPGDDPAVIASGPTVPDPTTCGRGAWPFSPATASSCPPRCVGTSIAAAAETPKPGDPRLAHAEVRLIAAPQLSLEAAAELARAGGVTPLLLGDALEGEAREVGKVMAGIARSVAAPREPGGARPPSCCPAARPRSPCAARAEAVATSSSCSASPWHWMAYRGIWAIAGDTDGIDGAEEVAGAVVAPDTLARARAAGLRSARACWPTTTRTACSRPWAIR